MSDGHSKQSIELFFREEIQNRRCNDDFESDRRESVWAVKIHPFPYFVHQKPSLFACDLEIFSKKIKDEKLGTRRAER